MYNSRNKLYESRNALRNYIFRLKKAENSGKVGKTKVYVEGHSYVWVSNGDEDKPKWYLVITSCKTMKEAEEYIKDKKAKLYLISPEEKVLKKHDKDFKNSLKTIVE